MILRLIGFGIRAWGCLYVAYWLIFWVTLASLIVVNSLKEQGHHQPIVKPIGYHH